MRLVSGCRLVLSLTTETCHRTCTVCNRLGSQATHSPSAEHAVGLATALGGHGRKLGCQVLELRQPFDLRIVIDRRDAARFRCDAEHLRIIDRGLNDVSRNDSPPSHINVSTGRTDPSQPPAQHVAVNADTAVQQPAERVCVGTASRLHSPHRPLAALPVLLHGRVAVPQRLQLPRDGVLVGRLRYQSLSRLRQLLLQPGHLRVRRRLLPLQLLDPVACGMRLGTCGRRWCCCTCLMMLPRPFFAAAAHYCCCKSLSTPLALVSRQLICFFCACVITWSTADQALP